MSESLPEQPEICSACSQPYTAHAPDCPHLLAVRQEGEAYQVKKRDAYQKAEGITDEFLAEVEQKGPDAVLEEQEENIAESHQVPVSEKDKKGDEEIWPLEKAIDKLHQLDELLVWARETLDEYKDKAGVDLNEVRSKFDACGKALDEVDVAYQKLLLGNERVTEQKIADFRQKVAACDQRLNEFINKYEVK